MGYQTTVQNSGNNNYSKRLLFATPTTGLVRIEWVQGRYGQVIPPNWSMVTMNQYINSYMPLQYQVDDAQNLIVKHAIEGGYEWVFLLEHDNILPPNALLLLNDYMLAGDTPIVSGLYFTRGIPSTPLLFRGRGNSVYLDWQLGDKVPVDGIPTGTLLVHASIFHAMWAESEEYMIGDQKTRRVFQTPRHAWAEPDGEAYNLQSGTSDLAWCDRIMKEDIFSKAGWPEQAAAEFPFLVDTNLLCGHIEPDGRLFPFNYYDLHAQLERRQQAEPPRTLGVHVAETIDIAEGIR